ncbi:unnamed protein product [Cunninghamella echinulata]
MDINADEAEAGSILMSLSQQTKKPKETSTTNNTMSIQNLLGAEEQVEAKQTKWNTDNMHRFPETTKEIYPERMQYNNNNIMHAASPPHPTATTSLPLPPSRNRSSPPPPSSSNIRYLYDSQPIQHSHSQQQQPLQSMRNNPKVKRNALHAYISYMTYSDMAKQKSNKHLSYNNSTPMANPPIAPLPTFSSDRATPTHHPLPLTAYLKQHIDTSLPSTPRPQPYHPHHQPNPSSSSNSGSWPSHPQHPYHTNHLPMNPSPSPSPSTPHPHPHYQYPPYSSSLKHPYDKKP